MSRLTSPGDLIRARLDELGMSISQLARTLGNSRPRLSAAINGKERIRALRAARIEYALGLPDGALMRAQRAADEWDANDDNPENWSLSYHIH